MHCTNCGAEVPAGGKFCPGCGAATDSKGARPQSTQPARQPASGLKMGCGIGAAVVVGLLVLAALSGKVDDQKAADAPRLPGTKVTATELWQAYQNNEAAAQQGYGGQNLDVSGTVSGVDLDLVDNPVVLLQTPNQFESVHADLDDASKPKAVTLVKGQDIVLHCTDVSEVIATPMLKNCRF